MQDSRFPLKSPEQIESQYSAYLDSLKNLNLMVAEDSSSGSIHAPEYTTKSGDLEIRISEHSDKQHVLSSVGVKLDVDIMDKILKTLNIYKLKGIDISTSNPSFKIKTYQGGADAAIHFDYVEGVKDTFYYANGFLNMFYNDQNLLEFFINRSPRIEEGWEKFSKKLVEEYEKVRKIGHSGSLEDFNKYILKRPDGDEYFIGKNVKLKKYIKDEEKKIAYVYVSFRGTDMPKIDDVRKVLVGMEGNGVYFEDIRLECKDVTFSICDLDKYNFWHGGRGFDFQIPKSAKNRIFSVSSFGLDVKESVSLAYEVNLLN